MSVVALDSYGNTAPAYGGTVHFTSSDGAALLPGNSTLASGDGLFAIRLQTAGNQTLTVTDTANTSIKGSTTINVIAPAGNATHFTVSAPSSTDSGQCPSLHGDGMGPVQRCGDKLQRHGQFQHVAAR